MVKWEQLSASEGGRDNNMELAKNLETPRLVIRSCRKTDTDFILSIWGERENGKFMTTAASDGAPVGTCCAYPENGNYDIGYSIAKDHWKEGLGTEMIGALLQWIRAEGGKSVSGEVADDNKASVALLHKFGFTEGRKTRYKKVGEETWFDAHILQLELE